MDKSFGGYSSGKPQHSTPSEAYREGEMVSRGHPSALSSFSMGLVDMAADFVDNFFRFVAERLTTVHLSLSSNVYDKLVAKELGLLKELQGRHGVHIHLGEGSSIATTTVITGSGAVRSDVSAESKTAMIEGQYVEISLATTLLPPYTAKGHADGTSDTCRTYAQTTTNSPTGLSDTSIGIHSAPISGLSSSQMRLRRNVPGGALVSVAVRPTNGPLRVVTITAFLEKAHKK